MDMLKVLLAGHNNFSGKRTQVRTSPASQSGPCSSLVQNTQT